MQPNEGQNGFMLVGIGGGDDYHAYAIVPSFEWSAQKVADLLGTEEVQYSNQGENGTFKAVSCPQSIGDGREHVGYWVDASLSAEDFRKAMEEEDEGWGHCTFTDLDESYMPKNPRTMVSAMKAILRLPAWPELFARLWPNSL